VKILLDEEQLRAGVRRLAAEINDYYGEAGLTIIGVLTGSIILLADLIRQLNGPLRVGLVQARSYRGGQTSPGPLAINADFLPDVKGRDVLLVDDIFDTGHTLLELLSQIDELGPSRVRTAVLLRKRGRQQVSMTPDYVGFEIPDEFVVGYGLDYDGLFRNLPYVAGLEAHEKAKEHLA